MLFYLTKVESNLIFDYDMPALEFDRHEKAEKQQILVLIKDKLACLISIHDFLHTISLHIAENIELAGNYKYF